jgi:hypothetical protein
MAREPKKYKRLTRNASGLVGYSSLWAASDHLMIVLNSGYNESYSRIDFRDVKAFIVTDSNRGATFAVVYGIITFVGVLLLAGFLITGKALYVPGIFLAIGVVGLAVNAVLGPTCAAYVVTEVQVAKLPSIVRRRQARRILFGIEPSIRAAQSEAPGTSPALAAVPPLPS